MVLIVVFFNNCLRGLCAFSGGVWGGSLLSLSSGPVGWHESVRVHSVPILFFILFFWGFLVHFMFFYFQLLSLPLIAAVFCCGCSFLFSIVWFCLCFKDFYCDFKMFQCNHLFILYRATDFPFQKSANSVWQKHEFRFRHKKFRFMFF